MSGISVDDCDRLSDAALLRMRQSFYKEYVRWGCVDTAVRNTIRAIDAELKSRGISEVEPVSNQNKR